MKRGRKPIYPWAVWGKRLAKGALTLRKGRDYDAEDAMMEQMIRNWASRLNLNVVVLTAEGKLKIALVKLATTKRALLRLKGDEACR